MGAEAHDHTAIMDMIARHAAADTEWDGPILLFALGRSPEGTYGIAPIRPWNAEVNRVLADFPPFAVLKALVATADDYERAYPGENAAQIALDICRDEPKVRPWFPAVQPQTVPCGIAMRHEGWGKSIPREDVALPQGSFADDPDATECLIWQIVSDDDQYMQVIWDRGAVAPKYTTWSFKGDLYRQHKDKQRFPTCLRGLMRINRRAARYRQQGAR